MDWMTEKLSIKKKLMYGAGDIGFSLPSILTEIYAGVANGGFGPGYGIMGVDGGFTDDMGATAVSLYQSYRKSDPEDPNWAWPFAWLPICHWGCIVYTVVDCVNVPGRVLFVAVGTYWAFRWRLPISSVSV